MKRLNLFFILAVFFMSFSALNVRSAWALCPASEALANGIYNLDIASCKLRKENRGRLEKPGFESTRDVCVLDMNCEATAPFNEGIRCPVKRKSYCWADSKNKCPSAVACANDKNFKIRDVKYIKPLKTLVRKK